MVGLPLIPYRFTQVNPYFQDTWKVTRNFTLNYGIAWFLSTIPEPVGSAAKLPHGFDESTGLLQYAALGQVDPKILSMNWRNFTPRLGFAWRPEFLKNTVIRAGAGTFYADTKLIEAQFAMVAPPFNTPITVNNANTNPTPQFVLGQNIFPAPPALAFDESYAVTTAHRHNRLSAAAQQPNAYVNQWNFSIQHSIRPGDLIEVTYMGASATTSSTVTKATSAASAPTCDAIRPRAPIPATAAC